jgi:AraC-like DNA-binding protein
MESFACSALFVRPFLRALARHAAGSALSLEPLASIERGGRVSVKLAYASVAQWVDITGDADLGLRASCEVQPGGSGALDVAMYSAGSIRSATLLASRYHRLFNDALDIAFEAQAEHAVVHLTSKLPWPRAVADFTLGAWYRNHLQMPLGAAHHAHDVEVWFTHPEPADVHVYAEVFGGARLCFGASHDGFRFPGEYADVPFDGGDARLHALHCEYLESAYAGLHEQQNFAMRVRALLADDLRHGRANASNVARHLQMSRRTMVRRLEDEGTSFREEHDKLRRQLAMRFLIASRLPLQEVAELLGFSHVQSLHRAFKRWTGETPKKYRKMPSTEPESADPYP